MSEQVADERAVIADAAGAFPVAHAGCLDNAAVVAHDIDEADEAFVEDGEFLPAEGFNEC
ncbi:MAG: hypothetical protein RL215_775 [Planctomycetota bacterium]